MSTKEMPRLHYWSRLCTEYILKRKNSNITFWRTELRVNDRLDINQLTHYYLDYTPKVAYHGPFDEKGVPMLNYFGSIGTQYNPDAIAQYALGHFEEYLRNGNNTHKEIFLSQADWFAEHLQERDHGVGVWEYDFDIDYFKKLKRPWYTALGQGHGISVLVRAHSLTGKTVYLDIARKAFQAFRYTVDVDGGAKYVDEEGHVWFEEHIVAPPPHTLNGFISALWGLYDFYLATQEVEAKELFDQGIETIEHNLHKYDKLFWSTYDLAATKLPCIASLHYHSLHIVQLRVLYILANRKIFKTYADKWENYKRKRLNRWLAFLWKAVFKVLYY